MSKILFTSPFWNFFGCGVALAKADSGAWESKGKQLPWFSINRNSKYGLRILFGKYAFIFLKKQ